MPGLYSARFGYYPRFLHEEFGISIPQPFIRQRYRVVNSPEHPEHTHKTLQRFSNIEAEYVRILNWILDRIWFNIPTAAQNIDEQFVLYNLAQNHIVKGPARSMIFPKVAEGYATRIRTTLGLGVLLYQIGYPVALGYSLGALREAKERAFGSRFPTEFTAPNWVRLTGAVVTYDKHVNCGMHLGLLQNVLVRRLRQYVAHYPECQVFQIVRHCPYGALNPIVPPPISFHTIAMDFIVDLPVAGRLKFYWLWRAHLRKRLPRTPEPSAWSVKESWSSVDVLTMMLIHFQF